MGEDELERSEIEALLATRRELGRDYDAALVDSFADRVERAVEQRVGASLAHETQRDRAAAGAGPRQVALGIVSAVMGIPVTAISLGTTGGGGDGLAAMVIAWTGLVGVNVAHAWQSRPQPRRREDR